MSSNTNQNHQGLSNEEKKNVLLIGGAALLGAVGKMLEGIMHNKSAEQVLKDTIVGGVVGGLITGVGKLAIDDVIRAEVEKRNAPST